MAKRTVSKTVNPGSNPGSPAAPGRRPIPVDRAAPALASEAPGLGRRTYNR